MEIRIWEINILHYHKTTLDASNPFYTFFHIWESPLKIHMKILKDQKLQFKTQIVSLIQYTAKFY